MSAARRLICRSCRVQDLVDQPGPLRWYDIPLGLVLFCLFPLGWILAIWISYSRHRDAKTPACASCGQRTMIPTDTPEGSRLAKPPAAA